MRQRQIDSGLYRARVTPERGVGKELLPSTRYLVQQLAPSSWHVRCRLETWLGSLGTSVTAARIHKPAQG